MAWAVLLLSRGMDTQKQPNWLAQILKIAIAEEICANSDVLRHVDPEALALYLPKELWGEILIAGLRAGKVTPDVVLATVSLDILAVHVPAELLWVCVAESAYRFGQSGNEQSEVIVRYRSFLKSVIEVGLSSKNVRVDELMAVVSPQVLAQCLPVPIRAELLRACLAAEAVSNDFLLQTIGLDTIATYAPVSKLWAVVSDALEASLLGPQKAAVATSEKPPVEDSPEDDAPQTNLQFPPPRAARNDPDTVTLIMRGR